MNYQGSYRRLLGNSKSAVVGAIEIYNKPNFEYRDEVFVVLLVNSWELLLKAIASRSGRSIYYKKRRGEPYRTVSLKEAFLRASTSPRWPSQIPKEAIVRNLEFLSTFRDNAVHFYNSTGFATVVYLLAQTSITNFHDLLQAVFNDDLTDKITWQLLPLALRTPIDPIQYLAGSRPAGDQGNKAVDEFLRQLSEATAELDDQGIDSSRLLTIYDVSLNSTKKIQVADIVVGVQSGSDQDQLLVSRRLDPNRSHPHRQTEALKELEGRGVAINSRAFQALVWKHQLQADQRYCWIDDKTQTKKWSPELIQLMESFNETDIQTALSEYRKHQRSIQLAKASSSPSRSFSEGRHS